MTPELSMVLWSAALLFAQIGVSAVSNVGAMGLPWGLGNHESPATTEGLPGRAKRAYMNMLENFPVFAAVVFVAQFAGVHNEMTVLGAEIFLVARTIYAIVYLAGFTFLAIRTIVWTAGIVGTAMVFFATLMA